MLLQILVETFQVIITINYKDYLIIFFLLGLSVAICTNLQLVWLYTSEYYMLHLSHLK